MAVVTECIEHERAYWKPVGEIRWFRPQRGDDNDLVLQSLWERITGEREWRDVHTVFAD